MKRQRAFTLVELVVVMGIILILIGLAMVGMRTLDKSAKEKSTKAALETAKSMLAELQTAGGISGVTDIYSTPPTPPTANQIKQPDKVTLDDYEGGVSTGRYKSDAVKLTQQVMFRLLAIPANKAVFQKLPAERLLRKPGNGPSITPEMQMLSGEIYPPLLLDGWGNPIIFVPWDGLSEVKIGSVVDNRVKSNEVVTPSTGPDKFTTGRPFWASAGPDGDFSTGDDNIYSFED